MLKHKQEKPWSMRDLLTGKTKPTSTYENVDFRLTKLRKEYTTLDFM